jgi:formyltetrahydrofolate deformylase
VKTRVLNVESPDKIGLVHIITGVLLSEALNIVENQEFVDRASQRFFMRTEVDGYVNEARVIERIQNALDPGAIVQFAPLARKRVVILASKEHHCVGDLLIRNQFREMNSEVVAVISNHEVLREFVQSFKVPFHHVPADGKERETHQAELLKIIEPYAPDYLVLAKYMRILTADFVGKFERRIVNIHHSFLPAFVGAKPYQQAYERGVKVIGATAHFVTDALDQGPIIVQQVIPVHHSHSPLDLAAAGRDVEQIVLARALKLVFEDRVFLCGNRTILFD